MGAVFLQDLTDFCIILLKADSGSDRIAQVVSASGEGSRGIWLFRILMPGCNVSARKKCDKAIGFRDFQQIAVVCRDVRGSIQKEERINQTTFDHGNDGIQLFTVRELSASLLTGAVDTGHRSGHGIDEDLAVQRLCQKTHDAEIQRVLGKAELVIGGEDDKNRCRAEFPDFPDRLDTVNSGHADIHDGDVRPEGLRHFNDGAATSGGAHLTSVMKFLIHNIRKRIDGDPFIIRQQNSVHFQFPL